MTGMEFLRKLAPLVPPPRVNLLRFHGVFAPNAKLRRLVVPKPPESRPTCTPTLVSPPTTTADPKLKADIDHIRRTGNTAGTSATKKADAQWAQPFPTKTKYEVKGGLNDVRGGTTLPVGMLRRGVLRGRH